MQRTGRMMHHIYLEPGIYDGRYAMSKGKRIKPLAFIVLCAMGILSWCSMSAQTMETSLEPASDTLNILAPDPSLEVKESYLGVTERISVKPGKVEGTLTYRKGWIYTSDNKPLRPEDAGLYFSPGAVKKYARDVKVFASGNNIMGVGLGVGLAGALGLAADTALSDYAIGAVCVTAAAVAVVTVVPCTIISCPMMIKGKVRMKRLVREYNAHYLFAE